MAITEAARFKLYEALEEVLGMEDATTLMGHLPPVGWADVATRADLDRLHDRIRLEIGEFRTEFRTEMRTEIAALRVEMADLRTQLHRDLNAYREQDQAERRALQRQMLVMMAGILLTLVITIATAL